MASHCQRSILSCARCRQRKIKCDRKLPSCSQCTGAKSECTGIAAKARAADRSASGSPSPPSLIPRSIVEHLEAKVAGLETALLRDGQLEVVHASDILLGMPADRTDKANTVEKAGSVRVTTTTVTLVPEGSIPENENVVPVPDVTGLGIDESVLDPTLRARLPSTSSTEQAPATSATTASAFASLRASIITSRGLQSLISATLPYEHGTAADLLSKVRMGLTPSSAKVRERRSSGVPGSDGNAGASRMTGPATGGSMGSGHGIGNSAKAQALLPAPVLRSMSWDIVQRLMRKYLAAIQPDNPFLATSTVLEQFQNVAHSLAATSTSTAADDVVPEPAALGVPPSHDFFVVYLVLAIAVTLGSGNDVYRERCAALSVSLFEEGIQHMYALPLPARSSELAWLQAILLVLLYATVFPRAANVWVLSGVAMRSCLELGLHREATSSLLVTDEDADLRRRVFWAAYCMDRSICSALQRPLSTPDAAISTRLPAATVGNNHHGPFLSSVQYHRLLSEMLHVHFQREPIQPASLTWEGWLADKEARLQEWYVSASEAQQQQQPPPPQGHQPQQQNQLQQQLQQQQQQQKYQMPLEFALARARMILHRPSPRVPLPSPASLLSAFEAATAAERIHRDHLRHGVFRRPWLSAHYTLEAATVVLFALRHGYDAIAARFTPTQIFDCAKRLTSNLLAIAAHGWPAVGTYAGIYERLLGPLLERVFCRNPHLDTARFGPAEDAELMRLLYPGPARQDALRFGMRQPLHHLHLRHRHQQRQQQHQLQLQQQELQQLPSPDDFSPFDLNLFMLDDEMWDANLMDAAGDVVDTHNIGWMALQETAFT